MKFEDFYPERICPLCGVRKATHNGRKYIDREHVPAKKLLIKPENYRKDMLITVPSCDECNSGTSHIDEAFQLSLAIYLGDRAYLKKELWKRAKKILSTNKRLYREFLEQDVSKLLVRSSLGYGHPIKVRKEYVDIKTPAI